MSQGDGTFRAAINIPVAGSEPGGITVADFANDGLGQAAITNQGSNDVILLSPTGVGNTATFLPGPQTGGPLSGPTNLQNLIDPAALDTLLSQIETLQGGNTAFLGPFDQRGLISPPNFIPPNFMAFTNLVYPNYNPPYNLDLTPLSLNAPGMFLSLTPATLNETGTDGIVNQSLSYTQNGRVSGWLAIARFQRQSHCTGYPATAIRNPIDRPRYVAADWRESDPCRSRPAVRRF